MCTPGFHGNPKSIATAMPLSVSKWITKQNLSKAVNLGKGYLRRRARERRKTEEGKKSELLERSVYIREAVK